MDVISRKKTDARQPVFPQYQNKQSSMHNFADKGRDFGVVSPDHAINGGDDYVVNQGNGQESEHGQAGEVNALLSSDLRRQQSQGRTSVQKSPETEGYHQEKKRRWLWYVAAILLIIVVVWLWNFWNTPSVGSTWRVETGESAKLEEKVYGKRLYEGETVSFEYSERFREKKSSSEENAIAPNGRAVPVVFASVDGNPSDKIVLVLEKKQSNANLDEYPSVAFRLSSKSGYEKSDISFDREKFLLFQKEGDSFGSPNEVSAFAVRDGQILSLALTSSKSTMENLRKETEGILRSIHWK